MKFLLVPFDYLGVRCEQPVPDKRKPGKTRKCPNRASVELNTDALKDVSPGRTHLICKDCATALFFNYLIVLTDRDQERFRPKCKFR